MKSLSPEIRSHVVIEYKTVKKGEDIEQVKQQALTQIKEKRYTTNLMGNILLVGIVHDKKRSEMISELVTK